jgi:hypothetical protein
VTKIFSSGGVKNGTAAFQNPEIPAPRNQQPTTPKQTTNNLQQIKKQLTKNNNK